MKMPSLAQTDRRVIWLLALLIPAALFRFGYVPYQSALTDAREQLAAERESLAKEQGAVLTAKRNPALQQTTDSVLHIMEPRLFEGSDDVIASSELAAYVGDVARGHHVWVQDAATRTATSTTKGVRTLHVEIRGESDLRGILDFLDAIDRGDKLVRIERLDVARGLSGAGNEQAETLTIAATVAGYAMGNLSTAPPITGTRAPVAKP